MLEAVLASFLIVGHRPGCRHRGSHAGGAELNETKGPGWPWRESSRSVWQGDLRPCSPPPLLTGKVGQPLCGQLGNMKVTEQNRCHQMLSPPIRCPIWWCAGAGPGDHGPVQCMLFFCGRGVVGAAEQSLPVLDPAERVLELVRTWVQPSAAIVLVKRWCSACRSL